MVLQLRSYCIQATTRTLTFLLGFWHGHIPIPRVIVLLLRVAKTGHSVTMSLVRVVVGRSGCDDVEGSFFCIVVVVGQLYSHVWFGRTTRYPMKILCSHPILMEMKWGLGRKGETGIYNKS